MHLSPPSRKRQGGVNRVPQALQACILTTSPSRAAPWCDRAGVWMPIGFSSLVPRASYLSYLLPLTSSPRYHQDASLDHCRVVDTAVVAVPEVQRLWVTPGMSRSSPRHTPLSATKMQAWRACGTRLTPPCRLRLGGDSLKNKKSMS